MNFFSWVWRLMSYEDYLFKHNVPKVMFFHYFCINLNADIQRRSGIKSNFLDGCHLNRLPKAGRACNSSPSHWQENKGIKGGGIRTDVSWDIKNFQVLLFKSGKLFLGHPVWFCPPSHLDLSEPKFFNFSTGFVDYFRLALVDYFDKCYAGSRPWLLCLQHLLGHHGWFDVSVSNLHLSIYFTVGWYPMLFVVFYRIFLSIWVCFLWSGSMWLMQCLVCPVWNQFLLGWNWFHRCLV